MYDYFLMGLINFMYVKHLKFLSNGGLKSNLCHFWGPWMGYQPCYIDKNKTGQCWHGLCSQSTERMIYIQCLK